MKNEIKKWEEISREVVFQKYSRKVEKVIFRLPSGKEDEFYLKAVPSAVCTLAITKNNEVIMAKQFRPGPNEILLEIPGGKVEVNETPEGSAARELLEETGYSGNMKLVAEAFDCAYSTMKRYCMVATDCEKVSDQKLDYNEFAEVVLLTLEEFRQLLRSGKMTDVEVGYLGLDYLNLL